MNLDALIDRDADFLTRFTWKRESRRFGEEQKGKKTVRKLRIVIAMDTSGSISQEMLDLLRRPDICWYIHRKHSGGLNLKEIFHMKLDGLKHGLAKFNSPSEFDEKVKTLDL